MCFSQLAASVAATVNKYHQQPLFLLFTVWSRDWEIAAACQLLYRIASICNNGGQWSLHPPAFTDNVGRAQLSVKPIYSKMNTFFDEKVFSSQNNLKRTVRGLQFSRHCILLFTLVLFYFILFSYLHVFEWKTVLILKVFMVCFMLFTFKLVSQNKLLMVVDDPSQVIH